MASFSTEPIAIVGSGCRFPGGASSPSKLWKLLEEPKDVVCEIPPERFDTTGYHHPDGSHHSTTNVRHAYLMQEDHKTFDAAFFNISPNEADSIDPQQRILLETVYEALEAGGHTIDALKGSDTAVYVGTMGVDYNDTLLRDLNNIPTYFATGTNRAIISNRVSYFFDWHGPSMTIDTACSSSLIAVHQGVTALRTGESRVAVACGTQMILGPEVFIFESKMKMLSPTGRSRMWDSDADGYARGEGVAAIVMKRLSDAIADGDHIECLIRGTGANQDGYSNGITVPSTEAQAALIRKTYANAGLDVSKWQDRPQFFEAHGTGTKAGDPKEAAAIAQCFGGDEEHPLYVGSVKTVIGHTEGAAGLAGLLKASGIIQKSFIPPNLLFKNLNPAINPFIKGLKVPTALAPWPELPEGVPKRVSVNSFGFGGSNAHAILEEYRPEALPVASLQTAPYTPFVFSAVSEPSLVGQLEAYSAYLKEHPEVSATDLAFTLQSRRSQLPIKIAFSASTTEELAKKIDEKLAPLKNSPGAIGIRAKAATPKVLGVFTGQGAQWAAMGAELIRTSEYVQQRIQVLEDALNALPEGDRPEWSLKEQMLAGEDTSRIAEAALSQPLCTAIQVVLVDLLKSAGISFSAVVGHSSGEIAAAYAAGFLSDVDAVRVAYYRGVYAKLAGNAATGQKGVMMAVGTSWEDAQDLCKLRAFRGRLAIAAHNSGASVTLSGDADVVILAKKVFDEEKKFARLLKVDTAYHSHHMLPCGDAYVAALKACGVKVIKDRDTSCQWFSSVTPSAEPTEPVDRLQDEYWRDNMTNAVLFADAVKNAVNSEPGLTYALEVGPHPALKGPAVQNVADVRSTPLPYSGVLSRGKSDIQSFSDALGFIWTQAGAQGVDFASYEKLVSGATVAPKLVTGLPAYSWNHARSSLFESRKSRKTRGRKQQFHEVLGVLSPESTPRDMRWTNVLKVSEIPWLEGHQLQGQCVFPAAGYCAMALEAAKKLAGEKPVELLELHDLSIPRAITFEDDANAGVETLVTLTNVANPTSTTVTADFSCYSCPANAVDQEMDLMASGSIKIIYGNPDLEALSSPLLDDSNMASVEQERFYGSLGKLGYGYYGPFHTMTEAKRSFNKSSVLVETFPYTEADTTTYMVHPSWLDVAFQAAILAYSAPGDERLWSLHVPTEIRSIRVNPEACAMLPTTPVNIPVCSTLADGEVFSASIDLFGEDGQTTMVQVEDLTIKPFAPATEADDRRLFSYTKVDVANPDGNSIVKGIHPTDEEHEVAVLCERLSYYYVRKWKAELTDLQWTQGQAHHLNLRDYVNHTLEQVARGQHPTIKKEWTKDTPEDIKALIAPYPNDVDIRLLTAVGENIPAAVRGETTILEHMLPNNLLDDFYKQGLGFARYNSFLAAMMKQVIHRYPHAKILEIGAGTGGATKSVLESIGDKFSTYTYTDISVGFFEKAGELFKQWRNKMTFKTLDVEKSPATQGYESGAYDIIIASNVLHATTSMQKTLEHTRQLLKPGGYLVLLEITNNGPVRFTNVMGGLSGWFAGVDDGRKYAPTMTPSQWNSILRKTGFAGVDHITPEIDGLAWPLSIMACQAVDERVNFLRRPLAPANKLKSGAVHLDSVVILGNQGIESSQIADDLSELLGRFCGHNVTILDNLPTEEEALEIAPMSTFVNLVDLDAPIFKEMTEEKMEGMKRLFELAKDILWVTVGAMVDNPYHMSSITFSRAMSHEVGHINLTHLDLSEINDNSSKAIAEYLLRQCALDEWEHSADSSKPIMWSKEPEAYLHNGILKVPRVVGNPDQNARLNSARRTITKTVPIEESHVSIALAPDAPPALVEEGLPLAPKSEDSIVAVQSSSLKAIHVATNTYLFFGIGQNVASNETVALLSTMNSRKTTAVASVPIKVTESVDSQLVAISSELVASSLVDTLASGSSLLVHLTGKDLFLAAALARRAAAKDVRVTFTVDADAADDAEESWIKLNSRATRHVVRKALQSSKATHYLDLTATPEPSELSITIANVLPAGFKRIEATDLSQSKAVVSATPETLVAKLEDAVSSAASVDASDLVISLAQLHDASLATYTTSAVSWKSEGEVEVEVRPLEAERLFSKDKTYFLLGLTGEIGRSLCEWMVANGAGCVVLTSRSPKTNQAWLDSFEGTGATVKVYALDITDRNAVENVVADIRATCPPIAGVANGAMVLHDCLFSTMSLEIMQKVLGPKIDGTNHLDQIFYDDPLDFFVMFSSSACVIGNSGQTNYAAANGYLNSLARQRRRRGLAASTFDIGRVAGIGYVETAGQAVVQQLTRFGLMAINEAEFREMFAETIRAGFPNPADKEGIPSAVITTGIRTIRDDEDIQGPWFHNPIFSHCIIETKTAQAAEDSGSKKTSLPVTEQLARAANEEQALEVLKDCFAAKLRVILQLGDAAIDNDAPLVELGVDSLVAVEVRSWFLKELKVDVPVLKVVGGASIAELCELALKKLPEELLGSIGSGPQEPAKPAAPAKSASLKPPVESAAPSEYNSTAPSMLKTETAADDVSTQLSSRVASSENLADAAKQNSTSTATTTATTTPSVAPTAAAPTAAPAPVVAAPVVAAAVSAPKPAPAPKPASTPAPAPKPVVSAFVPAAVAPKKKVAPAKRYVKSEQISFGQSRFWFLRLLLEDQTTSNVAFYYHVKGSLRISDLERAVRVVTTRHESLRTCFVESADEADQAFQKVLPSSPVRLEHKKVDSVEQVVREYHTLQQHVFDLSSGELLKLVVLTLSPTSHYFLFNYHHIIMDGVSFQVLVQDLEKAYKGESLGRPPRQFPDYSKAQRKAFEEGKMNDELRYWQGVFPASDPPPVLPLLPMAQTNARMPMKAFGVHQVMYRLEPELATRIRTVCKANRSTPFHFYLAAFKAMLFAFTDAKDLTIGIADANRNDADVGGSIGFFLNLLTLRFRRQDEQRFTSAITEARDTTYAALGNSHLPFDLLLQELKVERSSLYSPFFQAFFDYRQGAQEEFPFGNTEWKFQEVHPGRTAYDISLDLTDNATDALVIFRTQKGLYDLTAANLLLETYIHFLDALSADASLPQKSIPLFSQKQLTKGMEVGRGPHLVSDWPETLPLRIDQIASENASKMAVMDGHDNKYTYADLSNRIQAIAESMQKSGIVPGNRVLVYQTASADWPASMLAIMRLGAIYVPLDLRNPMPRLSAVAVDCEPSAVLVDHTTVGDAPQLNVPKAAIIDVSKVARKPLSPVPNVSQGKSPAAILYTSGSTGLPKGITVTHSGLRNEIEGYTKMWKLGAERTLQQSAFTFNHSSDQMYTGLTNGGMTYIVPWDKRGDPLSITEIILEHGITYTKATPSEYSLWMQFGGDNLKKCDSWRCAFGGGEPLTTLVTNEFADLGLPNLRFFNSYGPTEISISSTKMEMEYRDRQKMSEWTRIPCGFSLPNYSTYVVDEQNNILPPGMPGEVCLGGAGVSLGYLKNKELTDKHFVPDPFAAPEYVANGWTRMYRTGDIGHMQDDGAMVFHNRMAGDTQIKIRGLRIEISDIESNIVLAAGGAIREAVVTLREGDPDFLVAHVVFDPKHDIADKEVYLQQLLANLPIPQYMIPVAAFPIDKFPLTNHSKVDRKAMKTIPLPMQAKAAQDDDIEMTETMMQLKRVWQDVLGNKLNFDITPSTNFFLVGGNSLLVIRLQSRIRAVFNVVIRLVDLLGNTALHQMARKIEETTSVGALDWEKETVPPTVPAFLKDIAADKQKKDKKTVLITGSTGYLAKYLLPQLVANPSIATIHAVAVRDTAKITASDKIIVHPGDLSSPMLGLKETEFKQLASEADIILHMGAVRSFWDNYHVLRPVNVNPTKELIKLALPRQIPIHYISTIGVLPREQETLTGVSSAGNPPSTDGSNGYVATRWASERMLERSGLPTTFYRFLQAGAVESSKEMLDELVRFVDVSNVIPDMNGWEGRIDMMHANAAVEWVSKTMLAGDEAKTEYLHYESPIAMDVATLRTYIEAQRGDRGLEKMPGLRWIGRIKALGFDYFLTSQEATVGGEDGSKFESRR